MHVSFVGYVTHGSHGQMVCRLLEHMAGSEACPKPCLELSDCGNSVAYISNLVYIHLLSLRGVLERTESVEGSGEQWRQWRALVVVWKRWPDVCRQCKGRGFLCAGTAQAVINKRQVCEF